MNSFSNAVSRSGLIIAMLLSILNTIAASFGTSPAITWATGFGIWPILTIPASLFVFGWLFYSWLNSFMSNRCGMMIWYLNLALAPFGYQLWGLPYPLGLLVAAAPIPLYALLMKISEKLVKSDA